MSNVTMNASRDAFVRLLKGWHPSYFAAMFLFALYSAIDFFPSTDVLIWIQQKTVILSPHTWQVVLFSCSVGIVLTNPGAKWVVFLTAPAMVLGGMVIWYLLANGLPLLILVFVGVSYPAIFGVMVLSASVMKAIEDNALLLTRNAELQRQVEALKVVNVEPTAAN